MQQDRNKTVKEDLDFQEYLDIKASRYQDFMWLFKEASSGFSSSHYQGSTKKPRSQDKTSRDQEPTTLD